MKTRLLVMFTFMMGLTAVIGGTMAFQNTAAYAAVQAKAEPVIAAQPNLPLSRPAAGQLYQTPTLTFTVFLPVVVKPLPLARVLLDNDTGGQLCYEILGSGLGEKCFPPGEHLYGFFPQGKYTWRATARCGSDSGTLTFSGDFVHRFFCIGGVAELTNRPGSGQPIQP